MLPLSLLLLALLATAAPARADAVLFLSSEPRAAELYGALELELRGFGVLLAQRPAPPGLTPEARVAAVRASVREVAASAALWIERGEPHKVRALGADERVAEAPLPSALDVIEPRTFAVVAASVVLDLLGRGASAQESEDERVSPAAPAPTWTDGSRQEEYEPPRPAPRAYRLFARLAPIAGFALLTPGRASDRPPSPHVNAVDAAARAGGSLNLEIADRLLRDLGHDCDVAATPFDSLRLTDCTVALERRGYIAHLAIEGAVGLAGRFLSVSVTARITPDAGRGVLAHALLGAQLGVPLLRAERAGPWIELAVGAGVGQIQVRPRAPTGATQRPYVRSGLGAVRGGVVLGYRLVEKLGLYAGLMANGLFPYGLFVLDASLGLEVRT